MKSEIVERCVQAGEYIVETKCTIRNAAAKFSVSKSAIHVDMSRRLSFINPSLHKEVSKVLQYNKEIRHIRGGLATQAKYKKSKENTR